MNKFGLTLDTWERNVVQVALTHLQEMHNDILNDGFVENENPELSEEVIKTCKELLDSLL